MHLFISMRLDAKSTLNDGESYDKEHEKHGDVPQCLSDHENGMIVCSYRANTIEATDNCGIRPIKRSCILSEILLTDWILSCVENEFQNAIQWIHLKLKNPDPFDACKQNPACFASRVREVINSPWRWTSYHWLIRTDLSSELSHCLRLNSDRRPLIDRSVFYVKGSGFISKRVNTDVLSCFISLPNSGWFHLKRPARPYLRYHSWYLS